jgi:hypothetical protein
VSIGRESVDDIPAVIMGIAVTLVTLPNGRQIVIAPYDEFVEDLKSVINSVEGKVKEIAI